MRIIKYYKSLFILIGFFAISISNVSAGSSVSLFGDGRNLSGPKLWADNCSRCHNFRSPKEYTPNQWNTIMLHMRIQGGLTGKEARAILDYLTQASLSEFKTVNTTLTTSNQNESKGSSSHHRVTSKNKNQASHQSVSVRKPAGKVSGRAVFQAHCAACHGMNGKGIGAPIPDFTKKGGVLAQPFGVLLNNIKHGIGAMPAKGGDPSLTDQQLSAALHYIKGTF